LVKVEPSEIFELVGIRSGNLVSDNTVHYIVSLGGAVVSGLVCLYPDGGFEAQAWPGALHRVLGKDTLLLQCLTPQQVYYVCQQI